MEVNPFDQIGLLITVHYRDDSWKLSTKVLLTREMSEHHTGQNIADTITETATEWGIVDTQISAIIHDNAANANLAAELTGWSHFGCVAHTFQLCIKSALEVPAIGRLISACRKLVSHFRQKTLTN